MHASGTTSAGRRLQSSLFVQSHYWHLKSYRGSISRSAKKPRITQRGSAATRRLCPQITQIVADSKPRRGLGEGGFLPRFWAVRAGLAYTARHLPVFSFFASFRMFSGQFNPLKNLCRTHDDTTRNLLATFRVLWRVWRILCFCYPCHRRNPRFGSLYNSKLAQMHRLRAN